MVFSFAQFFDINVFLDFAFCKRLLQNFVVANKFPLIASFPVDPSNSYFPRVHNIYDLAVDCSSAELLDLFDVKDQGAVDPIEEIGFRDEESTLHHTDALVFIHCTYYNRFKYSHST